MARTNQELVEELVRDGYLKTPLLIEAFSHIDRKDFVPASSASSAYINEPLPIGYGQTISQPLTVAFMLELLEPKPRERILDVGAGSGWQTALLAYVTSKAEPGDKIPAELDITMELPKGLRLSSLGLGEVIAIERIPELKKFAEENLAKYNFVKKKIVQVLLGDATQGVPPELVLSEGFDKIIAAASAEYDVPVIWKKQLKVGGRIVAPVGTSVVVFDKRAQDIFIRREFAGFFFVPLVSDRRE